VSFVEVLAEDELWIGEMRAINVGPHRVLLLRTEHGVHAYADRCPHLGFPLSRGTLERGTLTCSAHHHQFDACTGRGKNPANAQLAIIAVACRHGKILVDVEPNAVTVTR
jgi:toluene monooxygenase system ferredoxin subunit